MPVGVYIHQREPLAERFWSKVSKSDGCWLWVAFRDRNGYGRFGTSALNRSTLAHRTSYSLTFGDIPEGMHVLHKCDNPPCVNPDHLFLGTDKDNAQDCKAKGRHPQLKKSHCPHGHAYDATNTYLRKGRGRFCRECSRETHRKDIDRHRRASKREMDRLSELRRC